MSISGPVAELVSVFVADSVLLVSVGSVEAVSVRVEVLSTEGLVLWFWLISCTGTTVGWQAVVNIRMKLNNQNETRMHTS